MAKTLGRRRPSDWNEFIELYCLRPYGLVPAAYQPAYLIFRYYNEVYNGGHFQFFQNCRRLPLDKVSEALRDIAGDALAENFDAAAASWKNWGRRAPSSATEYVEFEHESGLEEYDLALYRLQPRFDEFLETYLLQRKLI